jgi:hypothetical protein
MPRIFFILDICVVRRSQQLFRCGRNLDKRAPACSGQIAERSFAIARAFDDLPGYAFANGVLFAMRALLADAIQRDIHVGQSARVEFVIDHDNSASLPRGSESQRSVDVHRILGLLGLLQQRIAFAARWQASRRRARILGEFLKASFKRFSRARPVSLFLRNFVHLASVS